MLPFRSLLTLLLFGTLTPSLVFAQNYACPASPVSGVSHNPQSYAGQTLDHPNFAHQDLHNVDFSGAILIAPFFTGANLTGANFSGATFKGDPANPVANPNFLFANLDSTCFIKAQFPGLTDFTGANLTCADFSQTDLTANNGSMVFGEIPLQIDSSRKCRPAFRSATMNCEFVTSWKLMDLTAAIVSACASDFTQTDFSNAVMDNVDFSNLTLDGSKFVKTSLIAAKFNHSSLVGANFSNALLYGASLTEANLDGANMGGAFLTGNAQTSGAANLTGAFLRNVSLYQATLSGAIFTSSSFYGINPVGKGSCALDQTTGYTLNGCATAAGATMDATNFQDAYLYGVDFTDAKAQGVNFNSAYLAGANFKGATLSVNSAESSTGFDSSYLQGAKLDTLIFQNGLSFLNAFFDFSPNGNTVTLLLDEQHTLFPGYWNTPGTRVCAAMQYNDGSTVPETDSKSTCPDNSTKGCGPAGGAPWKSGLDTIPLFSYSQPSTYVKETGQFCTPDGNWNTPPPAPSTSSRPN
jgi:uncharacterized protein YjbI with pentapeptide repeats